MKDLESLLENIPKSLALWQQLGRGDPQRAIADINYEAFRPGLFDSEDGERLDALAWMVYWLMRYGHNPQSSIQREGSLDALPGMKEAWSVAKNHRKVRDVLAGVKSDLLSCEHRDGHIYLSYAGQHPELDLLVRSLRHSEVPEMPELIMLDLGEWLEDTGGTKTWFETPSKVQEQVRKAVESLADTAPSYMPEETDTPIGSVTLGHLSRYWKELWAISLYHHYAMQRTGSPNRTVFGYKTFVRHMSGVSGVSECDAGKITDHLTMTRDDASGTVHNPQLTPIVEVNGRLFLVSGLIIATMHSHHNIKLLQVGTSFGEMGEILGRFGEYTVAERLREQLRGGVHIAARLKVFPARKCIPGDADVVVYSPGRLLVVLEVKWHIPVNNTFEELQKERDARHGQCQMEKLREAIHRGEVHIEWPESWPAVDIDPREWKWFVVTHDTIPVHDLGNSDIPIRPYLLIKHHLKPGASVQDLVELLDSPDTPDVGESSPKTILYGDVTIKVENPSPHPDQPELLKNLESGTTS